MLSLLKQASLRKRLWQGAIALLLVVLTFVVGNFFIKPEKALDRHVLGQDFLAFYTAGTFAREGRFDDLYDIGSVKSFQHELAGREGIQLGDNFGPFWNPPFYAWIFEPISHLQFYPAVLTWTAVNALALLASIVLLCRMLPATWSPAPLSQGWIAKRCDWRNWLLIPILILTSMPLIQALSHGQNTCMSLLILCVIVTAWRGKQSELAGMACGLLFYKPQLAAVIAIVLIINLGIRALIGLAFVGGILAVVTTTSMPGAIQNYLHQLPLNVRFMQVEHVYLWERHVTLKALWRIMLQGRGAGEATLLVQLLTYASTTLMAFLLMRAAFRSRRNGDEPWTGETAAVSRDRLIAATIAATPLLMPFYFDYDLLLLAVPGTLLAAEVLRQNEPRSLSEKMIARTFGVLYLWMIFNPGITKMTGVNGTVILLSLLSVQLIVRASRKTVLGTPRVTVRIEELEAVYRRAA